MYVPSKSTRQFFYLGQDELEGGRMAMKQLKSPLIACTLLFFIFFIIGCFEVPCDNDADCDDGIFCNGEEWCDGVCQRGTLPCATIKLCDENNAICRCWTHADCEDNNPCTFDQCFTDGTCGNDPVECPEGGICNPRTGECE
jgi:hypothetical protein